MILIISDSASLNKFYSYRQYILEVLADYFVHIRILFGV